MNLEDINDYWDAAARYETVGGVEFMTAMINPITRSMCRLEPPVRADLPEREELKAAFALYCEQAWIGGPTDEHGYPIWRSDPARVNPLLLLEGTHPAPDLEQEVRDVASAFGYHSVLDALERHQARTLGGEE